MTSEQTVKVLEALERIAAALTSIARDGSPSVQLLLDEGKQKSVALPKKSDGKPGAG